MIKFTFSSFKYIYNVHLKTQEWKMDVNDRKTAISLVKRMDQTKKIEIQTIRSKPLTARKRTREDKRRGWGFFETVFFAVNL
ncbi:hypothetical protein T05_13875 [Trichinella murrelli]|uniref:Uncharacterized protein n=1 Tax=Trichinella murrelli TaxID=144512 RepID=A0A0V0TM19_9BILA|nr:hypothetical protein T05_13875 [Trichinella murrelli]